MINQIPLPLLLSQQGLQLRGGQVGGQQGSGAGQVGGQGGGHGGRQHFCLHFSLQSFSQHSRHSLVSLRFFRSHCSPIKNLHTIFYHNMRGFLKLLISKCAKGIAGKGLVGFSKSFVSLLLPHGKHISQRDDIFIQRIVHALRKIVFVLVCIALYSLDA